MQMLAEAVVSMDEDGAHRSAQAALVAGIPAYDAIMEGLVRGMETVSEKFEREEYFVPEVLLSADAFNAALAILRPHLGTTADAEKVRAVIGVVQGDTHDIGKNLVRIMMEATGFEVYDLGRDVELEQFVHAAEEVGAKLICLSTLMTTTMEGMREVIEVLNRRGIRDKYKVLVGGGPISPAFAREIGADGFASDASAAVRTARQLAGMVVPA